MTEALAEAAMPPLSDRLAGLIRCGYDVTVASSEPHIASELCARLRAAGMVCPGPPLSASVEETLRRQAGLFDVALLHGVAAALAYAALARRHQPRARLLLSVGELESARVAQRAAAGTRPELAAHAARLRTQESIAAWSVDAVLTSSAADAAALRAAVPGVEMHVLDGVGGTPVAAGLAAALRLPSSLAPM